MSEGRGDIEPPFGLNPPGLTPSVSSEGRGDVEIGVNIPNEDDSAENNYAPTDAAINGYNSEVDVIDENVRDDIRETDSLVDAEALMPPRSAASNPVPNEPVVDFTEPVVRSEPAVDLNFPVIPNEHASSVMNDDVLSEAGELPVSHEFFFQQALAKNWIALQYNNKGKEIYVTTKSYPRVGEILRVVAPERALQCLEVIHFHFGHPTSKGMLGQLKLYNSWICGAQYLAEQVYKECPVCSMCREGYHPKKGRLMMPKGPMEMIMADFLELKKELNPILVIRDRFSGFLMAFVLPDERSKSAKLAFMRWFSIFGTPRILLTDNGPAFTSKEFRLFTDTYYVRQMYSPRYSPQSNGSIERSMRSIQNGLRALLNDTKKLSPQKSLQDRINVVCLQLNMTTRAPGISDHTISPFRCVFNFRPDPLFLHPIHCEEEAKVLGIGGLAVGDYVRIRRRGPGLDKTSPLFSKEIYQVTGTTGHTFTLIDEEGKATKHTYARGHLKKFYPPVNREIIPDLYEEEAAGMADDASSDWLEVLDEDDEEIAEAYPVFLRMVKYIRIDNEEANKSKLNEGMTVEEFEEIEADEIELGEENPVALDKPTEVRLAHAASKYLPNTTLTAEQKLLSLLRAPEDFQTYILERTQRRVWYGMYKAIPPKMNITSKRHIYNHEYDPKYKSHGFPPAYSERDCYDYDNFNTKVFQDYAINCDKLYSFWTYVPDKRNCNNPTNPPLIWETWPISLYTTLKQPLPVLQRFLLRNYLERIEHLPKYSELIKTDCPKESIPSDEPQQNEDGYAIIPDEKYIVPDLALNPEKLLVSHPISEPIDICNVYLFELTKAKRVGRDFNEDTSVVNPYFLPPEVLEKAEPNTKTRRAAWYILKSKFLTPFYGLAASDEKPQELLQRLTWLEEWRCALSMFTDYSALENEIFPGGWKATRAFLWKLTRTTAYMGDFFMAERLFDDWKPRHFKPSRNRFVPRHLSFKEQSTRKVTYRKAFKNEAFSYIENQLRRIEDWIISEFVMEILQRLIKEHNLNCKKENKIPEGMKESRSKNQRNVFIQYAKEFWGTQIPHEIIREADKILSNMLMWYYFSINRKKREFEAEHNKVYTNYFYQAMFQPTGISNNFGTYMYTRDAYNRVIYHGMHMMRGHGALILKVRNSLSRERPDLPTGTNTSDSPEIALGENKTEIPLATSSPKPPSETNLKGKGKTRRGKDKDEPVNLGEKSPEESIPVHQIEENVTETPVKLSRRQRKLKKKQDALEGKLPPKKTFEDNKIRPIVPINETDKAVEDSEDDAEQPVFSHPELFRYNHESKYYYSPKKNYVWLIKTDDLGDVKAPKGLNTMDNLNRDRPKIRLLIDWMKYWTAAEELLGKDQNNIYNFLTRYGILHAIWTELEPRTEFKKFYEKIESEIEQSSTLMLTEIQRFFYTILRIKVTERKNISTKHYCNPGTTLVLRTLPEEDNRKLLTRIEKLKDETVLPLCINTLNRRCDLIGLKEHNFEPSGKNIFKLPRAKNAGKEHYTEDDERLRYDDLRFIPGVYEAGSFIGNRLPCFLVVDSIRHKNHTYRERHTAYPAIDDRNVPKREAEKDQNSSILYQMYTWLNKFLGFYSGCIRALPYSNRNAFQRDKTRKAAFLYTHRKIPLSKHITELAAEMCNVNYAEIPSVHPGLADANCYKFPPEIERILKRYEVVEHIRLKPEMSQRAPMYFYCEEEFSLRNELQSRLNSEKEFVLSVRTQKRIQEMLKTKTWGKRMVTWPDDPTLEKEITLYNFYVEHVKKLPEAEHLLKDASKLIALIDVLAKRREMHVYEELCSLEFHPMAPIHIEAVLNMAASEFTRLYCKYQHTDRIIATSVHGSTRNPPRNLYAIYDDWLDAAETPSHSHIQSGQDEDQYSGFDVTQCEIFTLKGLQFRKTRKNYVNPVGVPNMDYAAIGHLFRKYLMIEGSNTEFMFRDWNEVFNDVYDSKSKPHHSIGDKCEGGSRFLWMYHEVQFHVCFNTLLTYQMCWRAGGFLVSQAFCDVKKIDPDIASNISFVFNQFHLKEDQLDHYNSYTDLGYYQGSFEPLSLPVERTYVNSPFSMMYDLSLKNRAKLACDFLNGESSTPFDVVECHSKQQEFVNNTALTRTGPIYRTRNFSQPSYHWCNDLNYVAKTEIMIELVSDHSVPAYCKNQIKDYLPKWIPQLETKYLTVETVRIHARIWGQYYLKRSERQLPEFLRMWDSPDPLDHIISTDFDPIPYLPGTPNRSVPISNYSLTVHDLANLEKEFNDNDNNNNDKPIATASSSKVTKCDDGLMTNLRNPYGSKANVSLPEPKLKKLGGSSSNATTSVRKRR